MRVRRQAELSKVRTAIVVLFSCAAVFGSFYSSRVSGSGELRVVAAANPTPTPRRRSSTQVSRVRRPPKYSQFPHDVKAHRVSCSNCHKFPSGNWKKVRDEKDAFPDITEYPRHQSCINCHRRQFFSGPKPAICSICHTNPGPRNSARHPFPNPREIFDTTAKGKAAVSDFAISFPHDKHVDIVTANSRRQDRFINAAWARGPRLAEESCSVCHQTYRPQDKSDDEYVTKPPTDLGEGFWLKKGTFKTAPIGHKTCFTCHSADTGMLPAPSDCAACHKLKMPDPAADFDAKLAAAMRIDDKILLTSWRRRDSTGRFRHEFFAHVELSCSTCHDVGTMNTADPRSYRVKIDSCAACHVTATADEGGALNFEVDARSKNPSFTCVKCHITFGSKPIPESHLKAITAAGN